MSNDDFEDRHEKKITNEQIGIYFQEAVQDSCYNTLSEIDVFVKIHQGTLYRGIQKSQIPKKGQSYYHSDWHCWASSKELALKFGDLGGAVLRLDYHGQVVDLDKVHNHLWKLYKRSPKKWGWVAGSLRQYWAEERGTFLLPPSDYIIEEREEKNFLVRVE